MTWTPPADGIDVPAWEREPTTNAGDGERIPAITGSGVDHVVDTTGDVVLQRLGVEPVHKVDDVEDATAVASWPVVRASVARGVSPKSMR